MTTIKLTENKELIIVGSQNFKCANKPGSNLYGIGKYACLLWQIPERKGVFDFSGYQIDHVQPPFLDKTDNNSNLQALCIACHMVKTQNLCDINDHKESGVSNKENIITIKHPSSQKQCKKCKGCYDTKDKYLAHHKTCK